MDNKQSKTHFENDLFSIVSEPVVSYGDLAKFDLQCDEDLYAHEDVFREFARRLNQRIGANIPV